MGAAIPDPAHALQRPDLALGAHGRGVEQRMVVFLDLQHRLGRRRAMRVQRHEQGPGCGKPLQKVHPVGHRTDVRSRGAADVVPRRPHPLAPRHQGGVGVQHGQVPGVAEGAQQTRFIGGRRLEHGQRLIAVRCDHDVVETLDPARGVEHLDAVGHAPHLARAAPQTHAVGVAGGEFLHIGAAAALHRAPQRPGEELQEAMVFEEPHEGAGGIVADRVRRRRPDRRRLRQQVVVLERLRIALRVQIVAQTDQVGIRRGDVDPGPAVEPQEVGRHGPEPRAEQVGGPGEQRGEVLGRIFRAPLVQGHGEGHVRRTGRHVQVFEQGGQVRIVGLVEDDEARVHRGDALGKAGVHRVGVPAQPSVLLIDGDGVAFAEEPGRGHARYARPDHGDPFRRVRLRSRTEGGGRNQGHGRPIFMGD